MKSSGAVQTFNRSITCNKLRYRTYIEDEYTKSYHKSNSHQVSKLKRGSIRHVKKRLGTRLLAICTNKGHKLKR